MSGRGETPSDESEDEAMSLTFGQTVYNDEGEPVGTVRGMEEGGVYVSTREGLEGLSIEHSRSGHSWGEAELMWRCLNCGEMGELEDELPETCPNCGTEKENLMYWTED